VKDETEFRISGSEKVSITRAEVEAQQAAIAKLDERKRLAGKIRDIDPEQARLQADDSASNYRNRGHQAMDVRAGLHPGIRMPSDESFQAALDAGDMETAHLYRLQSVQPGTAEFMKKAPAGESVIEVLGPKGAEGFGVVERQVGTGPNAGKLITHFQEPEPLP
jgi:uncharacterized heparinase superfamily protein